MTAMHTTSRSTPFLPAASVFPEGPTGSEQRLLDVFRPDLTSTQRAKVIATLDKRGLPTTAALCVAERVTRMRPVFHIDSRTSPAHILSLAFWKYRRPADAIEAIKASGWKLQCNHDPEVLPGFFIYSFVIIHRGSPPVPAGVSLLPSKHSFDGSIAVSFGRSRVTAGRVMGKTGQISL